MWSRRFFHTSAGNIKLYGSSWIGALGITATQETAQYAQELGLPPEMHGRSGVLSSLSYPE